GKFPREYEAILALPGIGRYTAGAIASIAFNEPRPILDGNVMRVLTRIFGIGENPREKGTNARLWELAEKLVREAREKEQKIAGRGIGKEGQEQSDASLSNTQLLNSFANYSSAASEMCSHLNQSLMELGALICTPR